METRHGHFPSFGSGSAVHRVPAAEERFLQRHADVPFPNLLLVVLCWPPLCGVAQWTPVSFTDDHVRCTYAEQPVTAATTRSIFLR